MRKTLKRLMTTVLTLTMMIGVFAVGGTGKGCTNI